MEHKTKFFFGDHAAAHRVSGGKRFKNMVIDVEPEAVAPCTAVGLCTCMPVGLPSDVDSSPCFFFLPFLGMWREMFSMSDRYVQFRDAVQR